MNHFRLQTNLKGEDCKENNVKENLRSTNDKHGGNT